MKVFDRRTSADFEALMVGVGVGLLIGGVVLIMRSLLPGVLMILLGAIVATVHKRIRIDTRARRYREYVWFMGIAFGEIRKLEGIHSIQIRRVRLSQTMHSLTTSNTVRKYMYEGVLRFVDGERVFVARKDEKDDLIDLLKPIATQLNEKVVDLSDGDPKIV